MTPLAVAMARRLASAPSDMSITAAEAATLMTTSLPSTAHSPLSSIETSMRCPASDNAFSTAVRRPSRLAAGWASRPQLSPVRRPAEARLDRRCGKRRRRRLKGSLAGRVRSGASHDDRGRVARTARGNASRWRVRASTRSCARNPRRRARSPNAIARATPGSAVSVTRDGLRSSRTCGWKTRLAQQLFDRQQALGVRHFQQAEFQMKALFLPVAEFAVRAQHDLQMPRQIFLAEQLGDAGDARPLFAGDLQQGGISCPRFWRPLRCAGTGPAGARSG